MSPPEFVINERTMGIMGKDSNGNRKYYEKASFSITLLKHVDAGGQDSGFLCLVKCSITGQDRKCFFRTNKVLNGGVGKFIEELNQSCNAGVLMCDFDAAQFRMFLRDIMKSYFRNCENENRRKTYKAAKLIGRQEGSEVWVLDENTQINGNGQPVPEEDQEFVWIDDLFDDKVKTQEVIYPFKTDTINDVLLALQETLHTNFMASLIAVAGATLGLHYAKIIEGGNHFPVPVICGEHRLGKTRSARAALHLMGNGKQFFSSARERFIPRLCSRSTFPPVLDDIKNTRQLGELALAYFDGGKDGTCNREMKPKTCPLVTLNWEALDGLAQDYRIASRLVLIPFVVGPRSPSGLEAQLQAEERLKAQLANAPKALGALIAIDISNILARTNEIKVILAEACPDIDDRVLDNYSLLVSVGEQIINLVNDDTLVSIEMLEKYFLDAIYPLCIKKYQTKQENGTTTEDGEPIITSLILKSLRCEALTRGKLLTCINPNIAFTLKTLDQGERRCNGLAVALTPFLAKLSNLGLDTMAPQDRIKQDIRNHGLGVTSKAKQVFNINDDGATISRSKEAKKTTVFRNCVFIKRSAFGPEAWEEFATYFGLIDMKSQDKKPSLSVAEPLPAATVPIQPAEVQPTTAAVVPRPSQAAAVPSTPAELQSPAVTGTPTPAEVLSPPTEVLLSPAVERGSPATVTSSAAVLFNSPTAILTAQVAVPSTTVALPSSTTEVLSSPAAVPPPSPPAALPSPPVPAHSSPAAESPLPAAVPNVLLSPAATSLQSPQPYTNASPQTTPLSPELNDSGIGLLVVECDPINEEDLSRTLNERSQKKTANVKPRKTKISVEPDAEEELTVAGNGKSRSQNNNIEQNLRKRKSSEHSTEYKYCCCKLERSKSEEDNMVICDNKKRKSETKCPGNRYYHLQCLNLKSVPEENPWFCPLCKARLPQLAS